MKNKKCFCFFSFLVLHAYSFNTLSQNIAHWPPTSLVFSYTEKGLIALSWQYVSILITYDIALSVYWLKCAHTWHIQEGAQSCRPFSLWDSGVWVYFVSHFTVTGRIALLRRWSMESASRYRGRQWSVSLLAGCADILHLFLGLPTVKFLIAAKTASASRPHEWGSCQDPKQVEGHRPAARDRPGCTRGNCCPQPRWYQPLLQ